MTFLCYVLSFLIIINVIVFVHEYGHFQAAKKMGVKVTKFSIGMGPELFGITDNTGTRWSFAALPIGGYVMMLGDGDMSSSTEDKKSLEGLSEEEKKKSFYAKSNWAKMWIAFCGPLFNYIYAFAVVVVMSLFYGVPTYEPIISSIQPNSPAALAGLQAGDKILRINNSKIDSFRDINVKVAMADEKSVLEFDIERKGIVQIVKIRPMIKFVKKLWKTSKIKTIGIVRGDPVFRKHSFIGSLIEGGRTCWRATTEMFCVFNMLFSGKSSIDNFGGIVQMTKVAGDLSKSGNFAQLIMFTVMLSLNLGFINLFPLPILDGGRIVLCLAEQISGRKFNERFQEYLMIACMIFLIFLMLVTTVNDILNLEVVEKFISSVLGK